MFSFFLYPFHPFPVDRGRSWLGVGKALIGGYQQVDIKDMERRFFSVLVVKKCVFLHLKNNN